MNVNTVTNWYQMYTETNIVEVLCKMLRNTEVIRNNFGYFKFKFRVLIKSGKINRENKDKINWCQIHTVLLQPLDIL